MNDETYNWNAEEYLKASSKQQKWAAELIEKFHLKGNEQFVAEFVGRCVEKHPPDSRNLIHVPMMRLEVEAFQP